GSAVLIDDRLIEHSGAEIGGLLGDLEPVDQLLRSGDPAASHTRREHFRESAEVEHAALAVARLNRSPIDAIDVHELAVRIVLDDQEVVFASNLQHTVATALRHHASRWILKVRDDVQK